MQAFSPPVTIPDNGAVNVLVGTLPTIADGSVITDVILEVGMAHTWMGDFLVRLEYVDCASGALLYGTNVLCRPRGTNAVGNAPCGTGTGVGCSGNLGTVATTTPPPAPVPYLFSDAAVAPIGDGICPTVAPSGCYKPSPGGALVGFNGHLKGGCWRLLASDWAGGDLGTISYWAVWEQNQAPVPARLASWGKLKTLYR